MPKAGEAAMARIEAAATDPAVLDDWPQMSDRHTYSAELERRGE